MGALGRMKRKLEGGKDYRRRPPAYVSARHALRYAAERRAEGMLAKKQALIERATTPGPNNIENRLDAIEALTRLERG